MYLLQIPTDDFGLQLRTETTSETISQLQLAAKRMVRSNPEVRGMQYRIFTVIKNVSGKFDSKMLKESTITG